MTTNETKAPELVEPAEAESEKKPTKKQKRARTAENPFETGMLAFARSIQISEGMLWAWSSQAEEPVRRPVEVFEKGVRGQSSHMNPKPGKPFNPGDSNPQVIHAAIMPVDCDRLDIEFGLKVLPNALAPSASDSPLTAACFSEIAAAYADLGGFRVLAARYAGNIANGRFAWRNRTLTDSAVVSVSFEGRRVVFDPFDAALAAMDEVPTIEDMKGALVEGSEEDVDALVDGIARGLGAHLFEARVCWTSVLQPAEEVFPSQEYPASDAPSRISRLYAYLPYRTQGGREVRHATMHSQKIGAAIRAIDDWHGEAAYGAVPVNPYAGVQAAGIALRNKREHEEKASSFADLVKAGPEPIRVALEAAQSAEDLDGDVHFFMAVLVRGGVFGS